MLTGKILADLTEAQKQKDAPRLDTLRLLRAAIKNAEIEKGKDYRLSDEETEAVIRSSIKQLRDAREQFAAGGRQDLVDKTDLEIKILSVYLPAELSEAELAKLIDEAILELGATAKDFGKVMSAVLGRTKGRAEGSKVSALVRARLKS
ncbi:GatB/YqeY domain-containing protein [Patescibacteria group bacterium]|nr:MAG: GatB/YqeY domain-containing protein [Patescibacteria group bacterium]